LKLYVKRDRLKTYQAGKIVFQSSDDWTTLTMALTNAMEFCKAQMERPDSDQEYWKERYERYEKAYEELDPVSEIPWSDDSGEK